VNNITVKDLLTIDEECSPVSYLPNNIVSFNPSNTESVNNLLDNYGPEGVYEMAQVLLKAAHEDMEINNENGDK